MADLITYPVNNVEFDAADAELFHCTRTSGVFMGSSDDEYEDFDIVDFSANAIMVGPGLAWIRNDKFKGKAVAMRAMAPLDVPSAHSTYPRYDAIIIRYYIGRNLTKLEYIQGTAQTNPTRPLPVRNSSYYDLVLYHIYRPAGSSISRSNITDVRGDNTYCGYMVDDVSAFDSGKFLSKESYDPTDSVANAGGIAAYVAKNSSKVTISDSVKTQSSTTVASSTAVKLAYDRADAALSLANTANTNATKAIPKSAIGVPNGVPSLDGTGKVPQDQLHTLVLHCDENEDNSSQWEMVHNAVASGNYDIKIISDDIVFYYHTKLIRTDGYAYAFFSFGSEATLKPNGDFSCT